MTVPAQNPDRTAIAAQERDAVAAALTPTLGAGRAKTLVHAERGPEAAKAAETALQGLSERKVEAAISAAAAAADAADAEFDEIRPQRDEIVMSLALYGVVDDKGVRQSVRGLSTLVGLSRQRIHEMRTDALELTEAERTPGASCSKEKINRRQCGCEGHWLNNHTVEEIAERARKVGIKEIAPNFGLRKLDDLAEKALRAEERAKIARDVRDDLIRATDPDKWNRERVAAIIGKNVSQVSRIRGKKPGAMISEKASAA